MGLDVRLHDDLSVLRLPVVVAGRKLGNRLVIQPMEGCDANPDGTPERVDPPPLPPVRRGGGQADLGRGLRRGSEGRANPRQLLIENATEPALRELLQVCRQAHVEACGGDDDLLIGLQLDSLGPLFMPSPDPGPARPTARSAHGR